MEEIFSEKQKEAYNFFQQKLNDLVKNPLYKLKYVIIHENEIKGFFDTFDSALVQAVANYPQNDFIIQQVVSEDEVINFLYSAIA